MSQVRIQGNASGTGTLTIASPNTNSDFTLNLPASAGTIPVLSSVTNNGVVFINSSGQATSGSALTFDGTTLATTGKFGITGSGSIPTASALEIGTNGAGTRFRYNVPTGGEHNFTENGSVISFQTASAHGWFAGGSEQMRLTSTGLGIGTSSPSQKLHVLADTSGALFQGATLGGVTFLKTGQTGMQLFSDATGTLKVYDNNAGAAVLTVSNQNLGLGVTPSAWGSAFRAIEMSGQGSFYTRNTPTNYTYVGNNVFSNSSNTDTYKANGNATVYGQDSGTHYWRTAGSGTAGNAISWTQAMTLDASGNLGVGTTSPAAKLELGAPNAINTTNTFRISNPYYNYWDITNGVNGVLAFSRGGSEHMRIDNSGNLLVGRTGQTSTERLGVTFAAGNSGIYTQVASTATQFHISFNNGSVVGAISTNGSATTYSTSSDYRLKENIQPMTGALAKVAALKPCTYKWKADGSDGEGFIAHELAEVVPQCVTGEKDAVDAEGKPVYQGIDTSFLVATLTAAIQEQQAIIEQLTTRIAALEAK